MSLKGLHLEPLATDSAEFVQYQDVFGGPKLVKLYQITYEPTGLHNLEIFNSYPSLFFHGTGHCGCLARRNVVADSTKINSNDWCGRSGCATQGILNYGHMRTYSYSGHFFSPNWPTALGYAQGKSGGHALVPIFLVKARYRPNGGDICSVQADTDILPCYLAVLRNP